MVDWSKSNYGKKWKSIGIKKQGQLMITAGFFGLVASVVIWSQVVSQYITPESTFYGFITINTPAHTWSQEYSSLFDFSRCPVCTLLFYVSIVTIVIGFVKVFSAPDPSESIQDSIQTKKCPSCAETIKIEAIKCRFCGHEFDPASVQREITKPATTKEEVEKYRAEAEKLRAELAERRMANLSKTDTK